jgi:hypothetical protein
MDQPVLPGFDVPPVIEVTLRVGIVTESDHGQWLLEVRNPVSNELLSMESCPHFPSASLGPQASRMTLRLVKAIRDAWGVPGSGESPTAPR